MVIATKSSCKILLFKYNCYASKGLRIIWKQDTHLLTIISLINIMNSVVPSTEPCGIPLLTNMSKMILLLRRTLWFPALKKDITHFCMLLVIPIFLNFSSRHCCWTESVLISFDPQCTLLVCVVIS